MDCELCAQTQHRRCMSTFAAKYLAGDSLKAKCGARIRLEVIDRRTGDTIPGDMLRDTQVEVRAGAPPAPLRSNPMQPAWLLDELGVPYKHAAGC